MYGMLINDLDDKIAEAQAILSGAIAEHRPREIFALFSGGYDSLVISHLLTCFVRSVGVAHMNTGIGIERTRAYVRQTAKDLTWNFVEYHTPENYDALVLERGFPGPAHHWKMYCRLKDRSVASLVRDHKQRWKDRIMLVTGIRKQESRKRMGYNDPVQRIGARVWVNPILTWSKLNVHAYRARYNLPNNWVVDMLHMSGECLCGAYAHKGELKEIELVCPSTALRIKGLETRVRLAGHDWGWEEGPPPKVNKDDKIVIQPPLPFMPLCIGCENSPDRR